MKTAIIITGHMRSFDRCLPTLHWHVFRHYSEADFYVSTIDDSDAVKADLLREKYPAAQVEIEKVTVQPDCVAELRAAGAVLPDMWSKGTPYMHEPYSISVHPQSVLRQLWQLEQGWNLRDKSGRLHDIVIRCRPDLWFHSFNEGGSLVPTNGAVLAPWWGKFGGINDRFAIMNPHAAMKYFRTYSAIGSLLAAGCPLHPESLLAEMVRSSGFVARNCLAEFSTLRSNGEMRGPEISSIDLARVAAGLA